MAAYDSSGGDMKEHKCLKADPGLKNRFEADDSRMVPANTQRSQHTKLDARIQLYFSAEFYYIRPWWINLPVAVLSYDRGLIKTWSIWGFSLKAKTEFFSVKNLQICISFFCSCIYNYSTWYSFTHHLHGSTKNFKKCFANISECCQQHLYLVWAITKQIRADLQGGIRMAPGWKNELLLLLLGNCSLCLYAATNRYSTHNQLDTIFSLLKPQTPTTIPRTRYCPAVVLSLFH